MLRYYFSGFFVSKPCNKFTDVKPRARYFNKYLALSISFISKEKQLQ